MTARPGGHAGGRVTVVLLTHDCAHRLDTVLARLADTGAPVLAVDNGSRDGTPDVLAAAGVRVVTLSRNIGAAARNVGAALARTSYVAFCDDDAWYEPDALERAADALDRHRLLGLVNARILVGDEDRLDPISAEMADSPLPDGDGIPGAVLLSFMGGAAVVRRDAWLAVGGYHPRWFIGGEEETVAMPLARAGWRMRYRPEVVVHHAPSLASYSRLRPYGMRNTLCNAWRHRRLRSALRWTAFALVDNPMGRDWWRGVALAARGLPSAVLDRDPMPRGLDARYAELDRRRFAARRPRDDTVVRTAAGMVSSASGRCLTEDRFRNDHAQPPRSAPRRVPATRIGGVS